MQQEQNFDNPQYVNQHENILKEQSQQEHMKKLKDKLIELREEINKMPKDPEVFKNHQLPLARVKKIMKSDEDVRVFIIQKKNSKFKMIAQEAPVLFAKACEIFIIELTHRAWQFTEESKRRTLQKSDIATCIYNTEIFDFLMDIIPKDEMKNQIPIKKPVGQEGYFGGASNQILKEFQQLNQKSQR